MARRILFVLTSRAKMDNGAPTGWPVQPEFARPYFHLIGPDEAKPRAEIVVASPAGGHAPIDEMSVANFKDDASVKFYETRKHLWEQTAPLREFHGKASEFDAVFYPGGHGPMFDLVNDKDSIKLIEEFYNAGKVVAAVCHGPIALVNAVVDGKPLLNGRRATGFSNAEEDAIKLSEAMPALLEDEIKRVGGTYVKADALWKEQVVVDGRIITGQNPNSAQGVGIAIAQAIGLDSA
ncbi:chaperone hsp31 [Trichoderma arundinaceum]|uniref:D-lactate dehydratase n=1 Tax=Trichoderma arundinaceum TaxID=490622 RepID=A0A395NEM6_TRIAR|nr:chaperone hsp31 [Trichoderma arundinaceum]